MQVFLSPQRGDERAKQTAGDGTSAGSPERRRTPVRSATNISKQFGHVTALSDVSLVLPELYAGNDSATQTASLVSATLASHRW